MDDYKKYEADYEIIRQENGVLLDKFAKYLQTKNLSESTIKTHVSNVDFYINEFLLYEKANEAKNGTSEIGTFLGHWFIRKAMWASVNQIKVTAASLKNSTHICSKTARSTKRNLMICTILSKMKCLIGSML